MKKNKRVGDGYLYYYLIIIIMLNMKKELLIVNCLINNFANGKYEIM